MIRIFIRVELYKKNGLELSNMQIYILDNKKYNIGSIDTNSSNISNDKFIQYLETGAFTYEFDIILDGNNSEILEEKNYMVFYWRNKLKMFQIETIKIII